MAVEKEKDKPSLRPQKLHVDINNRLLFFNGKIRLDVLKYVHFCVKKKCYFCKTGTRIIQVLHQHHEYEKVSSEEMCKASCVGGTYQMRWTVEIVA